MRIICSLSIVTILLTGCGSHAEVSPSQNCSLNAVSPSTSSHQSGAMQQALDNWLKEEWIPATNTTPIVTTIKNEDDTVTTTTQPVTSESEKEEPFTLQRLADKWKVYHENKAKMKEGKPQEPSHAESLKAIPVIGH